MLVRSVRAKEVGPSEQALWEGTGRFVIWHVQLAVDVTGPTGQAVLSGPTAVS